MGAERHSTVLAVLGLWGCGCVHASAAPDARIFESSDHSHAFTVQDLARLDRISDLAASPDGKRVAYTVRTTDMDANKGRTTVWVVETGRRGAPAARPADSIQWYDTVLAWLNRWTR